MCSQLPFLQACLPERLAAGPVWPLWVHVWIWGQFQPCFPTPAVPILIQAPLLPLDRDNGHSSQAKGSIFFREIKQPNSAQSILPPQWPTHQGWGSQQAGFMKGAASPWDRRLWHKPSTISIFRKTLHTHTGALKMNDPFIPLHPFRWPLLCLLTTKSPAYLKCNLSSMTLKILSLCLSTHCYVKRTAISLQALQMLHIEHSAFQAKKNFFYKGMAVLQLFSILVISLVCVIHWLSNIADRYLRFNDLF